MSYDRSLVHHFRGTKVQGVNLFPGVPRLITMVLVRQREIQGLPALASRNTENGIVDVTRWCYMLNQPMNVQRIADYEKSLIPAREEDFFSQSRVG